MRRYSIGFALGVGASILVWWAVSLATGQVPESAAEPVRLAFHVAAEVLTALTLLAAGAGLLMRRRWARTVYLVGLGMLLYTAVGSPGYFAQMGQWPLVGMFAAVLAGAAAALWWVARSRDA
jgi:hypothetical protein